jgi:hypothetical protein
MGSTASKFSENFTGEKITVERLLLLIEKNCGAEHLDLSGKDLSNLRLTPKALAKIRQKRNLEGQPVWLMENGGINLNGVNLSWAVLTGADLTEASLQNADLRGAMLEHVDFIDADLSNAFLWDASLDFAVLDGTKLQGANLFGASFVNSTISRDNIGERVIQELQEYSLPDHMTMSPERNRFWQASRIYRHLKATFDGNGLYDNASWAYRRARTMEKHLAIYHLRQSWKTKQWGKIVKNLQKVITDSFVQALSDYGESPQRVLSSIAALWIAFAFIYAALSGVIDSSTTTVTHNPIDLLAFSLCAMTTVEAVGLEANNILAMRFLMPLETLFGIALTGLFGYVLGNRINRI